MTVRYEPDNFVVFSYIVQELFYFRIYKGELEIITAGEYRDKGCPARFMPIDKGAIYDYRASAAMKRLYKWLEKKTDELNDFNVLKQDGFIKLPDVCYGYISAEVSTARKPEGTKFENFNFGNAPTYEPSELVKGDVFCGFEDGKWFGIYVFVESYVDNRDDRFCFKAFEINRGDRYKLSNSYGMSHNAKIFKLGVAND